MPTASEFRSTLGGHDRSLADRAGAPRSATPPYPSDPAASLYCGGRALSSPVAVNTAMQPTVLLPPREPQIVLPELLAIGT